MARVLPDIAHKAESDVKALWQEIGYSPDEQTERWKELEEQVEALFSRFVTRERELKEELQLKVHDLLKRLYDVSEMIGEESDLDEAAIEKLSLRQMYDTINSYLVVAEKKLEERKQIVTSLHMNLHALCSELEVPVPAPLMQLSLTDYSLARIKAYEDELIRFTAEKTSRKAHIQQLMMELLDLWLELCPPTNPTDLDQSVLKGEDLGCTLRIIAALDQRKVEVLAEKKAREEYITSLAIQINKLWTLLSIPKEEQEEFLSRNTGLGPAVVEACEAELRRLRELRKIELRSLIDKARTRLRALWDELHLSDDERLVFAPAYSPDMSEENLARHEEEIARVEERIRIAKPILQMIERREEILKEKAGFEAAASDPSRLLARGHARPGWLLQEERMRRTIQKELPKIEERLIQRLRQWRDDNGGVPLLWNGIDYLQRLEADTVDSRQNSLRTSQSRVMATLGLSMTSAAWSAATATASVKTPAKNTAKTPLKTTQRSTPATKTPNRTQTWPTPVPANATPRNKLLQTASMQHALPAPLSPRDPNRQFREV